MNPLPANIVMKISTIQERVKSIKNNKKVEFGSTKFKYPDLGTIKSIIDPLLIEEKLSMVCIGTEHSFSDRSLAIYIQFVDTENGEAGVMKFETLIDTKQKNAVQCVGATTTYMQRYIKKIVFDLEFSDDDPDNMQPQKWEMTRGNATLLWNKYKSKQPENITPEDMKTDYNNWVQSIIGHSEIKKIDENQYTELMETL